MRDNQTFATYHRPAQIRQYHVQLCSSPKQQLHLNQVLEALYYHLVCLSENAIFVSTNYLKAIYTFYANVLQSIVYEYWPETSEYIIWTNALQNRWYVCIQLTRDKYSNIEITPRSISQIYRPSNEFMSVRSMFLYNTTNTMLTKYMWCLTNSIV